MRRDYGDYADDREDQRWEVLWRQADRVELGGEPDELKLRQWGWTPDDVRDEVDGRRKARERAAAQKAEREAYYATHCPACGGSGQIQTTTYDFNRGYQRRWTYCPSCDGTGKPKEVTE